VILDVVRDLEINQSINSFLFIYVQTKLIYSTYEFELRNYCCWFLFMQFNAGILFIRLGFQSGTGSGFSNNCYWIKLISVGGIIRIHGIHHIDFNLTHYLWIQISRFRIWRLINQSIVLYTFMYIGFNAFLEAWLSAFTESPILVLI
jgi:hypothetical protein